MKPVLTEAMAKKIFSVLPDTRIAEAFEFMEEKRVRHLLVVDRDDQVVGVLSDRDVKRAISAHVERTESLKIISEKFDLTHQVQDFMSWDIATINSIAPIRDVALKMLDKKISCLVVVNDENYVEGLVTTDDLIWILVKLLEEKDHHLFEDFKQQLVNSPLGAFANTLSQAGI